MSKRRKNKKATKSPNTTTEKLLIATLILQIVDKLIEIIHRLMK